MERKTVLLEEEIRVPAEELDTWENFVRNRADYSEQKFSKYLCAWRRSTTFPDGFKMDVMVCTDTSEERTIWTEAVLFDEYGEEYGNTEASDVLRGKWEVKWTEGIDEGETLIDHVYSVNVVAV